MAVKVHGMPRSTCTSRVLVALIEKNVEFEIVPVNLMKGEHKQPPFLALQPFGVIPVLQDGDLTLFESRAIIRYVADKYKGEGSSLYGSSPEERALVEQWIEVESQNFTPAAHPIFYQLLVRPMRREPVDLAVVEANLPKLAKVLDIYEERLSKTPYLAGDFFSLADVTHLPLVHHLQTKSEVSELFKSRTNLLAWLDRIGSRPSWQKVVSLM